MGLFHNVMREVCIIFQVPAVLKLKYARAMLRQIYIIDIKYANLIL